MQDFKSTLDSCRADIKESKLSPLHKRLLLLQLSSTERKLEMCVELGIAKEDDLIGIVEIHKTLKTIMGLQQVGKSDSGKWWELGRLSD